MKRTMTIFYTTTLSLMFHYSVSAQDSPAYTSTSQPNFIATTQSSKIISFNSIISKKKVLLSWTVGENQQTERFEVERSTDGKKFVFAAMIFGTDKAGLDYYGFFEKMKRSSKYYRVKTIAKDGSVIYSKTIIAGD